MDKELILIRVVSRDQIRDIIIDLVDAGIECKEKFHKGVINTKNVILKYIIIPIGADQRNYVKGMRSVGCFGFDNKTADYLTRGNNVCQDYTLIKYVKEMNEMG